MSGDESDQPPNETEAAPSDNFSLVGHEIRAEIIQVLGLGNHVLAHGNELSLSEVRRRLDTDVEPSQLHYHLRQLVGHFVEKTDDGYQLNSVGTRLSWLLRAGSLDRRRQHVVVDAGFDCYYCGTPIEATFDNGYARMQCSGCGHLYMTDYYALPLEVFEDEVGAFAYFSAYFVIRILSLGRGVCPSCGNPLTTSLYSLDDGRDRQVELDLSCASCGASWWLSVGMACLADPGLIAFCYDHGIDVLSTPHWELEFAATDRHVTVRSTDPWEVALEVTFDDETLELVVDGDLNVIERNRLAASDDAGMFAVSDVIGRDRTIHGEGDDAVVILPDQADCLQYFRHLRWPDGVTCPDCASSDTIKKGETEKGTQRYKCHNCNSTFTDLTGTIFAEHRFSLAEMFHIIWEIEDANPEQIAQQLDRSPRAVQEFVQTVEEEPAGSSDFELSDLN